MNAPDRIYMNARKSYTAARFLGGVAMAALLTGCVSDLIASTKVDPKSPIAPEVAKLATGDKDYPSFNEIPPTPTDVRPARVYGDRARAVDAARVQLDQATAPTTWTLNNTQVFAGRARSAAGPDLGAATSSDTESFANSVRKRATPPPPAQH
ncbi:MAG: hypothetical protein JWQ97_1353 [Phenylobacterium sp.]|nr:hypothetical protein [Phenylobacterium sp.]